MFAPASFRALVLVAGAGLLAACNGAPDADAYGNFEAEEVVVSAQSSGQIQQFVPVEGAELAAGVVTAVVDTTQLALERDQLLAQRSAIAARRTEVAEQLRSLEVQREIAQRSFDRTQRLHAQQAATTAQLEQSERETRVLAVQVEAARAGGTSVGAELTALDARVAQVRDRLARASVTNPVGGTVLATYARVGEMIQPGQPLYKVADLTTLDLRAYVTGAQLASFRIGDSVTVRVDDGRALRTYAGEISWVSGRAEFTPTPVQTRDDRSALVYAVKVRVRNADGALKIGMPGDVTLRGASTAAPAAAPPTAP
jgi:HlyD family secretion protein